jgi:hypothetical protein
MKSMLKSNMLADGGVMQQGGTVDPVSGNDVPPGAMAEEVRDDIPAQLSEGEFVLSADVVRYWGLEKLMALRDKAKVGLKKMEDIGQMGNADQVEDPESLHSGEEMDDDAFSAEVDDIISETDAESMGATREFSTGGLATPGTDYLAKYNIPKTSITNPALDVRAYKNADGRIMYITFFNGKPSTPIPDGFDFIGTGQEVQTTLKNEKEKQADTVTATETITQDGGGGGDGFDSSPTGSMGGGLNTDTDGQAMASTVSPNAVAMGLTGLSLAMGVPAVATPTGLVTGFVTDAINSLSHSLAAAANVSAQGSPGAVDSFSQVSETAPTATTGPSGTGGAAASAAAAAAAAAASQGMSAEAQGAASQAAADAAVSGADAAAAAAAGAAAAAAADNGNAAEGGNTAANAAAAGSSGDSSDGDGSAGAAVSGEAGWAKGGFVSRSNKKAVTNQKGLASRKK